MIWNFTWWEYDMERFAVTPCTCNISKWVGVVLKRTVGFNSTFRSVCSDRLPEKAQKSKLNHSTKWREDKEWSFSFKKNPHSQVVTETPIHVVPPAWFHREPRGGGLVKIPLHQPDHPEVKYVIAKHKTVEIGLDWHWLTRAWSQTSWVTCLSADPSVGAVASTVDERITILLLLLLL